MDDTQFVMAYGAFVAALMAVLLLILATGLDRKRYLRPVLYGFFFGAGSNLIFGGGVVSFLMGGAVTGYVLSRDVGNWLQQFRAGAINGTLVLASLFLALVLILQVNGATHIAEQALASGELISLSSNLISLYVNSVLIVFQNITIVGAGAVLGGILRKLLAPKPAVQSPPPEDVKQK
jgi:hypothetical protein